MRGFKALALCAVLAAFACACSGVEAPPTPPASGANDGGWILIDGKELSRGEVVYLMTSAVDEYAQYHDVDWNAPIGGVPARRYFLEHALELAVTAYVTDSKAKEFGHGLTAEEEDLITWEITWEKDNYGGQEAFLQALGEYGLTEELYRFYSYTVPFLREKMLGILFGEEGQYHVSYDDLTDYYKRNYISASYIFLPGTDDEGEPLTGDEFTTQERVAEALRRQAVTGENFFEMVKEHGWDYYMTINPEGMPIPMGMIGAAFDAALSSLKVEEISDVVITNDGFYIILRLPEDMDWFSENMEGIWYACAHEAFSKMVAEWGKELDITVNDAFWDLDPHELTAAG
ncbi:MAG: peptidylprolyl isomerase [Oscillospiraceae bacterium]|nr:peptidylprolyl isomerase [Oscillospiraceae bacterium]